MRCLEFGEAPRRIEWEHLLPAHGVLAGHGSSARILVENMSNRSYRAQVTEMQGNLLNEKMSPRQFCNEILPDPVAEVIDLAELPVRGARLAARGAESCAKIEAAASRRNRSEVIWLNIERYPARGSFDVGSSYD